MAMGQKEEKATKARKKETNRKKIPTHIFFYGILFLLLVVLDQVSKLLMRATPPGSRFEIVPGVFWLSHVTNTGASFSILQGQNALLLWVSVAALGALIYYHDEFKGTWQKVFYTLILAGIVGNLIDRVFLGAVTDLFDLGWFPVFNVADSCLSIGVIGLVAHELFRRKESRILPR
jgi:signal peptidase II